MEENHKRKRSGYFCNRYAAFGYQRERYKYHWISDIVLQLLAYVAETEREFIHQRQQEGIEAERAKGIRFGRPALEKPQNYSQIFDLWKECKISVREAARRLGVNHKTFLKWAREI